MGFDTLQDKLVHSLRKVQGKSQLSEKNMDDTLKEIRVALLEADVNYGVVKDFLNRIKEESIGQNVLNSVDPGQLLIKIVHDELVKLLGSDDTELKLKDNGLSVIMVVGLQGTGKTTQIAKIAKLLKEKRNKKVLMIAGDTIRMAAVDQLVTLGREIGVEVYRDDISKGTIKIVEDGLQYAKDGGFDVALVDTAGRLHIDEELMKELSDLKALIKPDEILLTVDALTGQDIVNVAKSFNDLLSVSGLIVTKFDGDSKGGGVLSVKAITSVPIKFTGVGEKVDDIEVFHPDRLAQRILGMGDVVTFVEKAQEQFDEKEAERSAKRFMSGKFTMDDLLKQLEATQKMGPIASLMKMIPGMGEMAKQMENTDADKQLIKVKAIIQSMTKEEREDPSIMRNSHKRRIASGSGTSINDVNRLLNQYERMKKMMKQMSSLRGGFPGLFG